MLEAPFSGSLVPGPPAISLSSLPSLLPGHLCLSPRALLCLCVSCFLCVSSIPWLVLVHRSSGAPPPPVFGSRKPNGRLRDSHSLTQHTPILPSLPLPSGRVLSPPACLALPWLRGVCGGDPEKAQCTPRLEHSNLSWARCHPEDSEEGKADPAGGDGGSFP